MIKTTLSLIAISILTLSVLLLSEPRIYPSYVELGGKRYFGSSTNFGMKHAPEGDFNLYFFLTKNIFTSGRVRLVADDCLVSIEINGQHVVSENNYNCNYNEDKFFDFGPYLRLGTNKIEVKLKNLGWDAGFSITPELITPIRIISSLFYFAILFTILPASAWNNTSRIYQWCSSLTLIAKIILNILMPVLFLSGFVFLCIQVRFDIAGLYHQDSPLYWLVGKAIAAGHTPYSGYFETKPPGIFILSYLSFVLFNSPFLTHILCYICPPLITICIFYSLLFTNGDRIKNFSDNVLLYSLGILSVLVSLYSYYRSGSVRVEIYGATCSLFFVMLLTIGYQRQKLNLNNRLLLITGLTLFSFFAVGLKEPFAMILLSCGLIIESRPRYFVLHCVIPIILSGVLGTMLLGYLNWLEPYINIYLLPMLTGYVPQGTPFQTRMTNFGRIWQDLTNFSLPLGLCILILILSIVLCPAQKVTKQITLSLRKFLIVGLAISCSIACVGLTDRYYSHHYVFLTPVIGAIIVKASLNLTQVQNLCIKFGAISAISLLAIISTLRIKYIDLTSAVVETQNNTTILMNLAAELDRVRKNCGSKKYLNLSLNYPPIYLYTKDLPSGPFFFQFAHFFSSKRKDYQSLLLRQLYDSDMVLDFNNNLGDVDSQVRSYLASEFTTDSNCLSDIRLAELNDKIKIRIPKN